MRNEHKLPERYNSCHRCHGTNTEQVGMRDDEYRLVYVAWCFDCKNDYGYQMLMDTVWDKEERI